MARRSRAAVPVAPRKTLLEWIDLDNGDTTGILAPTCSAQVQAFHAQILGPADDRNGQPTEPLQPPPGLHLAPLG